MTGLARSDWPKTKSYRVVQKDPYTVDIVAQQDATQEELEGVARELFIDMTVFGMAGRKMS